MDILLTKNTAARKNSERIIFLIPILILFLMGNPVGFAENSQEEKVTLNFSEIDIESVVRAIGNFTGLTFIFDPRVKGTINLVTEQPVNKNEAYELLSAALKVRNFALLRAEGYIMVVPEADGKRHSDVTTNDNVPKGQIVTRIFRLENESAQDLVAVLRPLISPNNVVAANVANNTLIITDYIESINRLAKIIKRLDTTEKQEVVVIPIKHAIANDIVSTVNRLLNDTKNNTNPRDNTSIYIDTRTNSVIVRSYSPVRMQFVISLVDQLDKAVTSPGNVHVVHLKNADATSLAQVLRSVVSGQDTLSNQKQDSNNSESNDNNTPNLSTGGAGGFIQADRTTNTLIITANDTIYRNLRSIIDQLDTRRAQVYVESLIVEVSADKAEAFGIQWAGISGTGSSDFRIGLLAGVSDNLLNAAGSAVLSLSETTNVTGLNALAAALENTANANILSMPNLITLDNEEAKIMVGKNVPFVTGQFSTASGTTSGVNPFQTIERKDIGLSLRIRPQISEGGTVKMEIYQETSSIRETTTSGLITNKRAIETNVLVDDGDIIVLGGLIEDSVNNTIQKVPFLGDLPLLGRMFQFRSVSRVKTNLMVFLRPTVLRTSTESSNLTADRYDYIGATPKEIELDGTPQLPKIKETIDFSRKNKDGAASNGN